MKGMFVNENERPYAEGIVIGTKTIETRSKNMLAPLVGERVAVIRTVSGRKPWVVGYVDIVSAARKDRAFLDANRRKTKIPVGSPYDTPVRWCYFLSNPEPCKPYLLPDDAIRHGRSWCEF